MTRSEMVETLKAFLISQNISHVIDNDNGHYYLAFINTPSGLPSVICSWCIFNGCGHKLLALSDSSDSYFRVKYNQKQLVA